MSDVLDLKQIERKAFRSTYADGLYDMYTGAVTMAIGVFMVRPEGGYTVINLILALALLGTAYGLYWAGKRYITLPRLGQVRFGEMRQRKKKTLALILGIAVLVQAALVGLTVFVWLNPQLGLDKYRYMGEYNLERLVVASVGSLFVGPTMGMMAFFNDFRRGYYIAAMMALAVFLMILFNLPVIALVIGVLIALPGLVLFIRFLAQYPLAKGDASNG
jgi:hypothetical protein